MMLMMTARLSRHGNARIGGSAPPRASPALGLTSVCSRISAVRLAIDSRGSALETRVDAVKNLEHNLVSIQQSRKACYLTGVAHSEKEHFRGAVFVCNSASGVFRAGQVPPQAEEKGPCFCLMHSFPFIVALEENWWNR